LGQVRPGLTKARCTKWKLWLRSKRKRALERIPATAESAPAFRQELDLFKRIARYVIKTCGDGNAIAMFKETAVVKHRRLRALGIKGHQPAISALPGIHSQAASTITDAIIRQKAGSTSKEIKGLRNFELNGAISAWLRIVGLLRTHLGY
jgi:hypothetical protein